MWFFLWVFVWVRWTLPRFRRAVNWSFASRRGSASAYGTDRQALAIGPTLKLSRGVNRKGGGGGVGLAG